MNSKKIDNRQIYTKRINTKQIKALYHLAEINYKIIGDLDNANALYNQIISMGYKQYYNRS